MSNVRSDKPFTLAGRTFQSRLLVGTGKYRDMEETRLAIEASGAEIVTVAVRRTNIGQNPGEPNLLDILPPDRYTILPNTAGCYDATEAVRTLHPEAEVAVTANYYFMAVSVFVVALTSGPHRSATGGFHTP